MHVKPHKGARKHLSTRVKHLLQKHSKFGLVQNLFKIHHHVTTEGEYFHHHPHQHRSGSNTGSVVGDSGNVNRNSGHVSHHSGHLDFSNFHSPAVLRTHFKALHKEDFQLGKLLGSGGFGSVYVATMKGKTVAVKVMHKITKNPHAQAESYRAELHTLRFKHPNICQLIAATPMENAHDGAWIAMEYVGSKSLLGIINDHTEMIGVDRRMKYCMQIASALDYAHGHKVAHLDLKPANILISESDDCKICDFGCSQKIHLETGEVSPTNRSHLTGTFAYRAPELLKGQAPTFKADIYSFGITLWQMLSRENPFGSENQHVVIFGVVAYGLRPTHPEWVQEDPFELCYRDLYCQCWAADTDERPSADELSDLLRIWKQHM